MNENKVQNMKKEYPYWCCPNCGWEVDEGYADECLIGETKSVVNTWASMEFGGTH
jgi:hypothetical protein